MHDHNSFSNTLIWGYSGKANFNTQPFYKENFYHLWASLFWKFLPHALPRCKLANVKYERGKLLVNPNKRKDQDWCSGGMSGRPCTFPDMQEGVLAMMTETARNTSLKNKHLRNCDYFAIILFAFYNVNEKPCNWISLSTVKVNTQN